MKLLLLLLLVPVSAGAGEVRLQWRTPCFQAEPLRCDTASVLPQVSLVAQIVRAVRFRDNDTLTLGEIPGRVACSEDSADFEFLPGTMGVIFFQSRNGSGKESCTYASYVFAIPAEATGAPGLLGSYYSDQNLMQLLESRIDPEIDFDWATESAVAGGPPDWFSVRWVGNIQVQSGGLYTFRIAVNDAGRLWIGATMPIDDWNGDGYHSATGVATLAAGNYPIRAEMMERMGSARMTLFWTPPGGVEEVVPATALSH